MRLLYSEPPGLQVWQGAAQEVLEELQPNADVVMTDVPYAVVKRYGKDTLRLNEDLGAPNVPTMTEEEIIDMIVPICQSAYIWCNIEQISAFRGLLTDAGMSSRLLIWKKTNYVGMTGALWMMDLEYCVFGRKSKAYFNQPRREISSLFVGPGVPGTARIGGHPNQKPLWLLQRMIGASCPPGGLVVDMFSGSGSTGVACKLMKPKRRYIGIELSSHYAKVGAMRLKAGK